MTLVTIQYQGKTTPAGFEEFTWTCPSGVIGPISIIAIGGGGPGGSAQGAGQRGGGGAGGCFVKHDTFTPVPGTAYTIKVPNNAVLGSDGADAEFRDGATVIVRARGGQKGGNGPSGAGGLADAAGCIGDLVNSGGNGSAGIASTRSGAGGGGAGTGGPGGNASGITAGAGAVEWGGNGGSGSTSTTGANGSSGQTTRFSGGGGGARANDGTLRNGGTGRAGLVILYVNVPDSGGGGGGAAGLYCDEWTGGDDPNIDSRTLDGCGGTPGGNWNKDEDYSDAGNLEIDGGILGADTSSEEPLYYAENTACPDGEGVTNFQGAEVDVRFPNHDTPGAPALCTLIWEDDLTGPSGPLADRAHTGGSAGIGTYRRTDNHAGSSPAGAQLTGDGAVELLDNGIAAYAIKGLTLPLSYDLIIDVERVGDNGGVGATVRGQDPYPIVGTPDARKNYGLIYATSLDPPTDDDLHGLWRGWVNNGQFGALITGSSLDPPGDQGIDVGETKSLRYRVRQGSTIVNTYFGPTGIDPCSAEWRVAAGVQDCQFGTPCMGTGAGDPGIRFNAIGVQPPDTGQPNHYKIKKIRIYSWNPDSGSTYFTDGYVDVAVRGQETPHQTYQVQLEGIRVSHTVFEMYLRAFDTRVGGPIFTGISGVPVVNVPAQMDTVYTLRAWVEDDPDTTHPTLYASVNGILQLQIDLVDHPGALTPLTGGTVGLGMLDLTYEFDALRSVEVLRFQRLCPVGAPPTDPCEGGPENPYPWDPPPFPQPMSSLIGWRNGAWRIFPDAWQWRKGQFQRVIGPEITEPQLFWGKGQMRELIYIDSDQLPPPDTDLPPFYDPCELLPEVPPGDVEVIPLTSRFFGISNSPTTVLGPLFTGCKRAQGNWTPMELNQVQARGGVLIGAQGGYGQYLLNGRFNKEHLVSVTVAKITPILSILQAATIAGHYFGYSFTDDFASHVLWPPAGMTTADIIWITGQLHALLPGIRIGVRGLPQQFSSNPGVDFYNCQYVSRRGTPQSFAITNYSLALSRNAFICLDLNYLHGGDGSSGVRWRDGTILGQSPNNWMMSPAEVVAYLSGMYDGVLSVDSAASKLSGSMGYMWDNDHIAFPGMINALTLGRNELASLPPL